MSDETVMRELIGLTEKERAERTLEQEVARLRDELEHYKAQRCQYDALVGKIQDIVEATFPKARHSDFDVLDQGVWRIATALAEAQQARDRAEALVRPLTSKVRKTLVERNTANDLLRRALDLCGDEFHLAVCPHPPSCSRCALHAAISAHLNPQPISELGQRLRAISDEALANGTPTLTADQISGQVAEMRRRTGEGKE